MENGRKIARITHYNSNNTVSWSKFQIISLSKKELVVYLGYYTIYNTIKFLKQ